MRGSRRPAPAAVRGRGSHHRRRPALGAPSWSAPRSPEPLPAGAEEQLQRFGELLTLAIVSADAHAQLDRLASTDHLTGLWNRRAFEEHLGAEVERAARHSRPMSLLVIDVDRFKHINDTHGHPVGDRVLVEIAARLRAASRAGEIVARIGGEEFASILPETDAEGALAAAARLRAAITERPFPEVGSLTVSAGVCDLADAPDAAELFRLADVALYRAKAEGRDRAVRYAPERQAPPAARTPSGPASRRARRRPDGRRDDRAEQLDGVHDLVVGQRPHAHLRQEAPVPEELVLEEDLLDHLRGAPHHQRPARLAHAVVLRRGSWATSPARARSGSWRPRRTGRARRPRAWRCRPGRRAR